jgi:hypothetical protein
MLFLQRMKKYRKIVFEIILFSAVLFCYGINSYSHTYCHLIGAEQSAPTNCVENCFSSDIDHLEDDQIIHLNEFSSNTKPEIQIPIIQYCLVVQNFSLSVWQPPQNC